MRIRSTMFMVIMFLFLAVMNASATDLKFSWLAPVDGDHVTGYKIYYGTESGTYPIVVDVGLPEVADGRMVGEVPGVSDGILHFFVATSYNEDEESDYSTIVEYRAPWPKPGAPPDFQSEVVINISATNVKINIGDTVADN